MAKPFESTQAASRKDGMRAQLLLVPIAAISAMSAPASAEPILSVAQAQKLLFPNATFTPNFFDLSTEQYIALRDSIEAPILVDRIKAWRVSTGGWFIVDAVHGRDDLLVYAIGLTPDGAVTGIEILECASGYEGVTEPSWRRQFVGARRGRFSPDRVIFYSGASLSSRHIAEGIERTLATFDLFLKGKR